MHKQELFNKIIDQNQMPQEWEIGITLLPATYILFANTIKNKLN